MKISDVIALLQQFDPDSELMTYDHEQDARRRIKSFKILTGIVVIQDEAV